MAQQWLNDSSVHYQTTYAKHFEGYAEGRLRRQEVEIPPGMELPGWLRSHEEELRTSDVTVDEQRVNQSLIAYALLPIFEADPTGWNAIARFPVSVGRLADYLKDWHSSVDSEDKDFVATVSNTLGHKVNN